MNTNPKIHLIDIPVGGHGGIVWDRLHSERESICEAMLKDCQPDSAAGCEAGDIPDQATKNWHRELMQARLRKIDDALDRLMSGSYGNCCKCGRWIEDTKLEFDPAVAFCLVCWSQEQRNMRPDRSWNVPPGSHSEPKSEIAVEDVVLETLEPFSTILVRTANTDYRILLLDPRTGRALVEGGQFLTEPREGLLTGSKIDGSPSKPGSIAVGCRLEIWVDEKILLTSPIQSLRVQHRNSEPWITPTSGAVH